MVYHGALLVLNNSPGFNATFCCRVVELMSHDNLLHYTILKVKDDILLSIMFEASLIPELYSVMGIYSIQ